VLGLTWAKGLILRRWPRLVAAAAGVAVAVALLGSLGSFLSSSKATMTKRAIADVPIDWQVEAKPGTDPAAFLRDVARHPGVETALPVGFATSVGFRSTTPDAGSGTTTQTTGPGIVLGLPDGYRATFPSELRDLAGAGAGTLIFQQTAANLHVGAGDTVEVTLAGGITAALRIDGVVDLPKADSLFQDVGASPGSQPLAPPDNVLLLPLAGWHQLVDPVVVDQPDIVKYQIHTRVDHRLPADPAGAFAVEVGRARNLELALAGAGTVGNNLGADLDRARKDALYAQVLFVFLGLPGAILAGLLTGQMASVGRDRRRREQSILRARGASTRTLLGLAAVEAALVSLVGGALGLGAASMIGRASFGTAGFGATTGAAVGWAAWAAGTGAVIAIATTLVPAWSDARSTTVAAGRASTMRPRSPRWQRYGLDFLLLAGAGIVFRITSRSGYQLVLVPEGVPQISVNYWAFVGPAFLWSGAGLAAWRLSDLVLGRCRRLVTFLVRPLAGRLASTVAATLSRQRRTLARALVLTALTGSFAASTAVFNATYRQQAEVHARLTNGGDVTVNVAPGVAPPADTAARLAAIGGVRSVEPLQHRFAYVGTDLQDLYGIRADTIVAATSLQDGYFKGGTAAQLMGRLRSTRDGVLVSAETVKDFQLLPGDQLTLRLQDARTKQPVPVRFHYLGIVNSFPTAPRDSFLVANANYVADSTADPAASLFLIDARGASPPAVARAAHQVMGTSATVTDITTSRQVFGSSLTAVDLAGLTRVELGFALVLAAAATGLVLALGLAERRRTFAIAGALGARPRQLGAFVWTEAATTAVGGLLAGAAAGWALSEMLVKVLTGVFNPAPSHLAVPWGYLGTVIGTAGAAIALAATLAALGARRPAIRTLRDL